MSLQLFSVTGRTIEGSLKAVDKAVLIATDILDIGAIATNRARKEAIIEDYDSEKALLTLDPEGQERSAEEIAKIEARFER